MTDSQRVTFILSKVGLAAPAPIPELETVLPGFHDAQPDIIGEARQLLVQQRIHEPNYRHPSEKKRRLFMTRAMKQKACDHDKWTFRKHEVAKAFDTLLHRTPLARPELARALLGEAGNCSVVELWAHLQDPALDKKLEKGNKAAVSKASRIAWLSDITAQGSTDYIALLASAQPGQDALDHAFSVALSNNDIEAIKTLLKFGARAYTARDAIQNQVRLGNITLVRLLLSTPKAMNDKMWASCITPAIEAARTENDASHVIAKEIMLLYFAHKQYPDCPTVLYDAIKSRDLQSAAVVLAYSGTQLQEHATHQRAFELATRITRSDLRHDFLSLLLDAGMSHTGSLLACELLKDVKDRHFPLVKLLIQAGVQPDAEPYHSLKLAVSLLDFDILDLLKVGTFSSSARSTLNNAPSSATEEDMVRLADILSGISQATDCETFGHQLIYAVRNQRFQLANTLVRHGASVRVDQVAAIRAALQSDNQNVLQRLLAAPCSPSELSHAIPKALAMKPRSHRLRAMSAILKKGVVPRYLDVPLQSLAAEDDSPDLALVQLLLDHGASVGYRDDNGNCILTGTRRGDLSLLKVLCSASPPRDILADSVYCAFGQLEIGTYTLTLDIITLLLQKGARGEPLDRTLVRATLDDVNLDIIRALLNFGANANYSKGICFVNALNLQRDELIRLLCSKCKLAPESLESVYPVLLSPLSDNKRYLELILGSAPNCSRVLDAMWNSNKIRDHKDAVEIIQCFLEKGMDVNVEHGSVVSLAVETGDTHLLARVLTATPSLQSLRAGFEVVARISNSVVRHQIMKSLLECASSAEIGQSELVLQATTKNDLPGLSILLQH